MTTNEIDTLRWQVCHLQRSLGGPAPTDALETLLNGLPANWRPHIVTVDSKGGLIVVLENKRLSGNLNAMHKP